jgi:hypothetical protein
MITKADYITYQIDRAVVFQAMTPRSYKTFEALAVPLDDRGSYRAPDEAAAEHLWDRLDAQDLRNFTLG